jgi:hypothetical protein
MLKENENAETLNIIEILVFTNIFCKSIGWIKYSLPSSCPPKEI